MTVLRLRVVSGAVGRCVWCLRLMPQDELDHAADGVALVCRDATACVEEECRQDRNAWPDHEFARPA